MVGRKKETGSGGEDERAEDHVEEPEDKEGMVTCTKTTSPATFREFSARPKSSEENELASYVSNRFPTISPSSISSFPLSQYPGCFHCILLIGSTSNVFFFVHIHVAHCLALLAS